MRRTNTTTSAGPVSERSEFGNSETSSPERATCQSLFPWGGGGNAEEEEEVEEEAEEEDGGGQSHV